MVRAPGDFSTAQIERRYPSANSKLAAAVSDDDFVLHDQRRHGEALANVYLTDFRSPHFLSTGGVDGDGLIVERVVNDFAVGVRRPAVHHIAAGNALRSRHRLRLVDPFHRGARLGEIQGV